jgi:hypothetical protein
MTTLTFADDVLFNSLRAILVSSFKSSMDVVGTVFVYDRWKEGDRQGGTSRKGEGEETQGSWRLLRL